MLRPGDLPRLNEVPYDDPFNFVDTWDITMSLIEQADSGGGDQWEIISYFFGNGYLTGITPELAPSPALGLILPEGFRFFYDGELIEVDEDTYVGTVSPAFEGWVSLEPTYDMATDSWDFELVEHAAKPVNGVGLLGYVEADADGIVVFDPTGGNSDEIPTLQEVLRRIRNSGGSGGGGGIDHVADAPWSVTDPRPSEVVIQEMIDTAISNASSGATVKPMQGMVDILSQELALTRNYLISLIPHLSDVTASSNVLRAVDGIIGDGSNGHPDVIIATNMNLNDEGDFEP